MDSKEKRKKRKRELGDMDKGTLQREKHKKRKNIIEGDEESALEQMNQQTIQDSATEGLYDGTEDLGEYLYIEEQSGDSSERKKKAKSKKTVSFLEFSDIGYRSFPESISETHKVGSDIMVPEKKKKKKTTKSEGEGSSNTAETEEYLKKKNTDEDSMRLFLDDSVTNSSMASEMDSPSKKKKKKKNVKFDGDYSVMHNSFTSSMTSEIDSSSSPKKKKKKKEKGGDHSLCDLLDVDTSVRYDSTANSAVTSEIDSSSSPKKKKKKKKEKRDDHSLSGVLDVDASVMHDLVANNTVASEIDSSSKKKKKKKKKSDQKEKEQPGTVPSSKLDNVKQLIQDEDKIPLEKTQDLQTSGTKSSPSCEIEMKDIQTPFGTFKIPDLRSIASLHLNSVIQKKSPPSKPVSKRKLVGIDNKNMNTQTTSTYKMTKSSQSELKLPQGINTQNGAKSPTQKGNTVPNSNGSVLQSQVAEHERSKDSSGDSKILEHSMRDSDTSVKDIGGKSECLETETSHGKSLGSSLLNSSVPLQEQISLIPANIVPPPSNPKMGHSTVVNNTATPAPSDKSSVSSDNSITRLSVNKLQTLNKLQTSAPFSKPFSASESSNSSAPDLSHVMDILKSPASSVVHESSRVAENNSPQSKSSSSAKATVSSSISNEISSLSVKGESKPSAPKKKSKRKRSEKSNSEKKGETDKRKSA